MAITVQRGPSMIDYGMAVAKAAEQSTANDRAAQYANYLAGIQKAGQDYGLGLGNLGVAQSKLGLEATGQANELAVKKRALDQGDYQNRLESDRLRMQTALANNQNVINMVGATSGMNNSYANLAQSMLMPR